MASVLFYAAIIAGFAFPACLIKAIKHDNEDSGKTTVLSCICFGVVVTAILVVTAYS